MFAHFYWRSCRLLWWDLFYWQWVPRKTGSLFMTFWNISIVLFAKGPVESCDQFCFIDEECQNMGGSCNVCDKFTLRCTDSMSHNLNIHSLKLFWLCRDGYFTLSDNICLVFFIKGPTDSCDRLCVNDDQCQEMGGSCNVCDTNIYKCVEGMLKSGVFLVAFEHFFVTPIFPTLLKFVENFRLHFFYNLGRTVIITPTNKNVRGTHLCYPRP